MTLRLLGDGQGYFSGWGHVQDDLGIGNTLIFRWQFDQTQLRDLHRGALAFRHSRASKARQLLRQLAQDGNPWIRAEAHGHLEELRRIPHKGELVRHAPPRLEREYVDFARVSIATSNYLSVSHEADYSLPMLASMAQWMKERHFIPGEDFRAYYLAFGTFHRERNATDVGDPATVIS